MSLKIAEELHASMMVRQRLLESAESELRGGFVAEALGDVLDVLKHVQRNDRALLELHAECHGLIEYCRKVIAADAMRRPITVPVEPKAAKGSGSR